MAKQIQVLVLYDQGDLLDVMAEEVAAGARTQSGVTVVLRKPQQAQREDLLASDAIIIGTPNWTGMKGTLKRWLDTTGDYWEEGLLVGKLGAAFTTSAGRHSGTEFTLLNALHWQLGSGMLIVGLPWTPLMERSGSYYGATAIGEVTDEDRAQAQALGRRVAEMALRFGG